MRFRENEMSLTLMALGSLMDSSRMLKRRIIPFVTVAVFCLCGCTKSIEYEEEVLLGDPPKIEVIKRREILELLIDQLSPKWTFRRSELFLFGKNKPVWSDHLRPLYLEKLPDEEGYLLVAGINSSIECYERGRPNSYYVTIKITKDKATEIPTPHYLQGKQTNLVLTVDRLPDAPRRISIAEKDKLNRLGMFSERERKLLLSAKFGC